VAFKILFTALEVAAGTGGHINADATLLIPLAGPIPDLARPAAPQDKLTPRVWR
jgi:hypothetical protein